MWLVSLNRRTRWSVLDLALTKRHSHGGAVGLGTLMEPTA
jgi:hypothetical protein